MLRVGVGVASTALALIASGCVLGLEDAQRPAGSAPEPRAETPSARPVDCSDCTWTSGYWFTQGGDYQWVPGHWQAARPLLRASAP